MDISNPHDKFFKEILSVKENAIDFIKNAFPAGLRENLDLSTLELDNNSYVDEELRESFSDIVYKCCYKGKIKIKISILFEHKSYVINYPHLQLLKYIMKIWETNIKQKEPLVPVVPIVFYHGKEKWILRNLTDYFEEIDETLKEYLPEFKYLLTDLSVYSDANLKQKIFSNIALCISFLFMKNECVR